MTTAYLCSQKGWFVSLLLESINNRLSCYMADNMGSNMVQQIRGLTSVDSYTASLATNENYMKHKSMTSIIARYCHFFSAFLVGSFSYLQVKVKYIRALLGEVQNSARSDHGPSKKYVSTFSRLLFFRYTLD